MHSRPDIGFGGFGGFGRFFFRAFRALYLYQRVIPDEGEYDVVCLEDQTYAIWTKHHLQIARGKKCVTEAPEF